MIGAQRLAASLLMGALVAPAARAQSTASATVPASADVSEAVAGDGLRDLAFGTVAPGASVDTGPGGEANMPTAKWEFTGLRKNRDYTLIFDLPPVLSREADEIPVRWDNAGYGSWCARTAPATASDCGAPGTLTGDFDPASLVVTATTPGGTSNNDRVLSVYLGARLGDPTIPTDTPPGLYTGTITLTIIP